MVRTGSDHKFPGRFAPEILQLWRGNWEIGYIDLMKCVQIVHDYCWLYGIICANLLSPLAIAEWIEMMASHLLEHTEIVSARDSRVV